MGDLTSSSFCSLLSTASAIDKWFEICVYCHTNANVSAMLGFSVVKTRPVKCSGFEKLILEAESRLLLYVSAALKVSLPYAFSIVTNLSTSVTDDIHMLNDC